MNRLLLRRKRLVGLLAVVVILLPFYLSTLQTIPNGSEHYYMIDVGEAQAVLNTWGTLHATGYPLHVMLGSALVSGLRLLGISPAAAPSLVGLLWGLVALALIYILAVHLTAHVYLSAAVTILVGLTRTVWIHQVIAEVYTFGLAMLALLLLLALWHGSISRRIYWLAFVGGIGVFHHRAIFLAAPALLYAVWQEFSARPHQIPRRIIVSVGLGLLGFLPYVYLPLRANAGARWVYGEPNSWQGFWDQFTGREAARFIGTPSSPAGLLDNLQRINSVLIADLTVPGLVLGLLGLLIALRHPERRRTAVVFLLNGLAAYGFHVLWYTDILSALILPVIVSVAFGWLFLAEMILQMAVCGATTLGIWCAMSLHARSLPKAVYPIIVFLLMAGFAAFLIVQNYAFIGGLTRDATGLDTIALAKTAPAGSTLMLDWGPRYFAVSFAQDVLGELPAVQLVDHRADFKALIPGEKLITPDYTFFNRPVNWWQERTGGNVYLRAVAPRLVQISPQAEYAAEPLQPGIRMIEQSLACAADTLVLNVAWATATQPELDWSVFVHLLGASGQVIDQADVFAPVYGWRPTTTWGAREVVRDVYKLPRRAEGSQIRYGLYHQLPDGSFQNTVEYELSVRCDGG
jgi:hypothetical protein